MRCTRKLFESTFGTRLSPIKLDSKEDYVFPSFFFPSQGSPWKPMQAIADTIDDAYIQWPHIYMGKKRRVPPGGARVRRPSRKRPLPQVSADADFSTVNATPPHVDYYHLEMPDGVPALLNVKQIHQAGTTGVGVRVVMIDSGFAHRHPFFVAHGFKSTVDLAPHAINDKTDPNGHGTGESTNLFAVAPGITFIGIKLDHDGDPRNGATLLEGFQQALQHQPQVISVSLGFDLRTDGKQSAVLPNSLAALEAEIQAAVAKGIVVVFSAGNGHFSFPGMMSDVISAGGVFVAQDASMEASDYASAFPSKIYPGRFVPDFCGLVGMQPHASYIMLPIPLGSEIDRETSQPDDGLPGDGTAPDDGWGVFSGTSAAAPQLAGVCALLLQKNPGLTPSDIKAVLRRTARTVTVGAANPSSSDDNVGEPASASDTGAAGAGLVDAFKAWQQV
jgi:subtilisin family serine protease